MIRASIDIGTNSVLLLVADVTSEGITTLEEIAEVPRLGKGVDGDKSIHPDSQKRVLNVLKGYKSHLEENYDLKKAPIITATSAVRDASNREEFLSLIKRETGWGVILLSGLLEAETTYSGALSVLNSDYTDKYISVLDIGGGSTEIAFGKNNELEDSFSIDMGSVRFSERFLTNNPPTRLQMQDARDETRKLLGRVDHEKKSDMVVGVAGTVTSVAAIDLELTEYDVDKLNDYRLSSEKIEQFLAEFSKMTCKEIEEKYPVFLKNRGDVIVAGLLILSEFLKFTGHNELVVSTGGIRHGILLQ